MKTPHDPARARIGNYPLVLDIPTRFGDMDSLRHINNVAIASWYETARSTLVLNLFDDDFFVNPREFRFLVLTVTITYLREAPYPGVYQVAAGIDRIGTSSVHQVLGLFRDGACVGLCDSVMVHAESQGSTPLPAERRALLETMRFDACRAAAV